MRKKMSSQISKFSLIGILNFSIDIGVLNLLIFLFKGYEEKVFFSVLGYGFTFLVLFKIISFLTAKSILMLNSVFPMT